MTMFSSVKWTEKKAVFSLIIFGALLYANSLYAPWYLDDFRAIVDSSYLRDLKAVFLSLFRPRGVANLSFAVNYQLGGYTVFGYHLVNVAIHLLTGVLVFLLLKRVFRHEVWLPFAGALIFLAHPLQTQAVTYIVQRMTSLSGLLFFLTLYLFVRAREELDAGRKFISWRHLSLYLAVMMSAAAAVLTKENAAVLPLALVLFHRYFAEEGPSRSWKSLLCAVSPFFVVPCLLAVQQVVVPLVGGSTLKAIGGTTSLASMAHISPLNYLVTEFSVLWLYIRLLFLPYGQMLDYGYPVVEQIWTLRNGIAFMGLVGLLTLAFRIRKKLPLISFGIFWFFLALAVESTIIPLDPIFEHRLYVPMFGFVLVLIGVLQWLAKPKIMGSLLFSVILILSVLTWNRNALWSDELAFAEDNMRKAPDNERAIHLVANLYVGQKRYREAEQLFLKAIEANITYEKTSIDLARLYILEQRYPEALQTLLRIMPSIPASEAFYHNLGIVYDEMGSSGQAKLNLQRAILIKPDFYDAYTSLGLVFAKQKQWQEAIGYYRQSIYIVPYNGFAHYNLGEALYALGQRQEALQEFQIAVKQDLEDPTAFFRVAEVALALGDKATAQEILPRLQSLDVQLAMRLWQKLQ